MDSCGPLRLFHNNGDGTFTDHSSEAGLSGQLGGLNLAPADYNNDGCLDVLVWRGGWEVAQRNDCYENRDGTFTDVTIASGLRRTCHEHADRRVGGNVDNDGFRV